MFTSLIAWFILSYGLMNIVVYGSIFSPVRETIRNWSQIKSDSMFFWNFMDGMINCAMCFSMWGGMLLGIILYSPTAELFYTSAWYSWFFDGILSSGSVWAINAIVEWFESNRKN